MESKSFRSAAESPAVDLPPMTVERELEKERIKQQIARWMFLEAEVRKEMAAEAEMRRRFVGVGGGLTATVDRLPQAEVKPTPAAATGFWKNVAAGVYGLLKKLFKVYIIICCIAAIIGISKGILEVGCSQVRI
ncbi:hypothetical protein LINPERHAP2_LOCUS26891 [Linum perenne]